MKGFFLDTWFTLFGVCHLFYDISQIEKVEVKREEGREMEEFEGGGRGKVEFDKGKQKVPKGRDRNEMKLKGVTVKIELVWKQETKGTEI